MAAPIETTEQSVTLRDDQDRIKPPEQSGPRVETLAQPNAVVKQGHLGSLDGLRGLAALAVMIGHSAYIYYDTADPTGALLAIVNFIRRAGHPVVILFFALSGFVLYIAFFKKPDTPYRIYLLRRIARIYPALLVSLIIATILILATQSQSGRAEFGPWTQTAWPFETDLETFIRNALLIGVLDEDVSLNPVIWSLVVELRFSIIFVGLALLCRRSRWSLIAVTMGGHLIGRLVLNKMGVSPPFLVGESILGAVALTLFYLPSFGLGIAAADWMLSHKGQIRIDGWLQIALCGAFVGVAKIINDDLAWCFASTGVVLIASLPGPVSSALILRPVQFLGKISYSLYLIHFPILMATTYVFTPHIGLVTSLLLAPTLSTLAAALMYRYVEVPGINFGKRCATALAGRP